MNLFLIGLDLTAPLWVGVLTGILICIPVGPINVWVVHTLIKKNKASSLAMALGAALMDIVYFLLILSGLEIVDHFWGARFTPESILLFKKIFYFFGIVILLFLGFQELRARKEKQIEKKDWEGRKANLWSMFFFGIFLYVSNPTLFLTMSAIASFLKTSWILSSSFLAFPKSSILLLSLGLGIGTFLWFYFLVSITEKFHEKIREKYLPIFTKSCGVLMLLLAFLLMIKCPYF